MKPNQQRESRKEHGMGFIGENTMGGEILQVSPTLFTWNMNSRKGDERLESSEITPDLIIGQDLLNQVLCCDTPAMILPSGLILTPTIFGYTISGSSKVTSAKIKDDFVRSTHFNVVPISTATEGQERNITRKVDPRRKHMPSRTSRRKHRQQATQTSDSRKQDCMKLDSSSKSSARALLLLPYRTGRDENTTATTSGKNISTATTEVSAASQE
ncbi:hypothetical protein OSTOST_10853 [Ostertagia ostertagi]